MQLSIIPVEQRALVLTNALHTEGHQAVERLLGDLVDVEGDGAALPIIEVMDPKDLAYVLHHGDSTKLSFFAPLVTSKQLVNALEHTGLFDDVGYKAMNILSGVIITEEDSRKRNGHFRLIAKSDLAIAVFTLAIIKASGDWNKVLFYHRTGSFDFNTEEAVPEKTRESNLITGDWEELLFYSRKFSPVLYNRIIELINMHHNDRVDDIYLAISNDVRGMAEKKLGGKVGEVVINPFQDDY